MKTYLIISHSAGQMLIAVSGPGKRLCYTPERFQDQLGTPLTKFLKTLHKPKIIHRWSNRKKKSHSHKEPTRARLYQSRTRNQ